jgi:hypothetical protein
LCAAVGKRTFAALSKIGIRTIFDLERAVLDARVSTPHIRHEIGKLIVQELNPEGRTQLGLADTDAHTAASDRTVTTFVEVAVDYLHVQRLRQIYNCITERLGRENIRLDCASPPRVRKSHFLRKRAEMPTVARTKVEIVASDGRSGDLPKASAMS